MKKITFIILVMYIILLISINKSSSIVYEYPDMSFLIINEDNIREQIHEYRKVLLNEEGFFYTDKSLFRGTNILHKMYLNELTYNNDPTKIQNFAILDLDNDGLPEIVLEVEEYRGYVVLSYKNNKVYGFEINYRSMELLKSDGSFMGSSGAHNNSLGYLRILGDAFYIYSKIFTESVGISISYYLHNIPTTKLTWDKLIVAHDALSDIEWYEYSDEVVNQRLSDYHNLYNSSIYVNDSIDDRQKHLDSLAYLIDYTIFNVHYNTNEEIYKKSRNYYNYCKDELDKIYQMCSKKLSIADIDLINREQQKFMDNNFEILKHYIEVHNIDSSNETTYTNYYFTLGNIMLNRTIHLIDIFYGIKSNYWD